MEKCPFYWIKRLTIINKIDCSKFTHTFHTISIEIAIGRETDTKFHMERKTCKIQKKMRKNSYVNGKDSGRLVLSCIK